jgi:glycosyltransferase involved in cell wall biosynthesis
MDDFRLFHKENIINIRQSEILPGSGVDTNKFTPLVSDKKNKIRFLHASRLIWEKGIAEYVDVAREIRKDYKNVEFYILGFLDVKNTGAIQKEHIDGWVQEGVITYLGTTDNIKSIIKYIDCIILASYYREGTPKILLEGASMGKPIITTNSVGCRDVVEQGVNGYLVEPRNRLSLYASVIKFLNLNEQERDIMGKSSRAKMVKEFDEKIVISKYLKAINRAIEEKNSQQKEEVYN